MILEIRPVSLETGICPETLLYHYVPLDSRKMEFILSLSFESVLLFTSSYNIRSLFHFYRNLFMTLKIVLHQKVSSIIIIVYI